MPVNQLSLATACISNAPINVKLLGGARPDIGAATKTVKSPHYGTMTTVKSPAYARPPPPVA